MRDEQLDRLLSDFRAIADEQMKDLTLTEAHKQRILRACLSPESEKQNEKQSEKAVPFWKSGSALRKWGTAAAAAAVLLVAVLGGAKVFLTGTKPAYQEQVSGEAAAEAPEMAAPAEEEAPPESKEPDSFFAAAEAPAPTPVPEQNEAVGEDGIAPEAPASTSRPDGGKANGSAPVSAAATPEPAIDVPQEDVTEEVADEWEDDELLDDEVAEDADADIDDASGGELPASGAPDSGNTDDVIESPAEEEPPADSDVYPGAARYLSARIVSCETVRISLADGMPLAEKAAALAVQSGEEAAVPAEEEPLKEAPEQAQSHPAWRENLSCGTVEGESLVLHVATVTVDLVHWGEYISPGTLLKVIVPAPLESGQSVSILLAPASPQTGPNAGIPLRVDLAAPWYVLGFTGNSAEEIDAVTKALE